MSIHDKSWKYTTAEKSKRPGYLRAKFAKLKAEQSAKAAEDAKKVQPIKRKAAA